MRTAKQVPINQVLTTILALVIGFIFMTGLTKVSADTFVVYSGDTVNVNFNSQTAKIKHTTYPYKLSGKEVTDMQRFNESGTSLTITTNKHHVITSVKKRRTTHVVFVS